MNEEAKGHKCVCLYWLSACLQCLLAVTETETQIERGGGGETHRKREGERRGAQRETGERSSSFQCIRISLIYPQVITRVYTHPRE
jgi:hypothetical protein